MLAAAAPVFCPPMRLDLEDDIDEDDEDEDDDRNGQDSDDDDDESDFDDDDEEPETWQVSHSSSADSEEYSKRGISACESPKGRLNLTFRPRAA
jgi:hypothetical protein